MKRKEYILCRCSQRNGDGGKFCMRCECPLVLHRNLPPTKFNESLEEYAARCGPFEVRELENVTCIGDRIPIRDE